MIPFLAVLTVSVGLVDWVIYLISPCRALAWQGRGVVVTQVSNLVDMVVQGLASYLGEILLWGVTSYRSWCTVQQSCCTTVLVQ